MDLGLNGKVIIITGPTKGLGPAITLAFAREGCKLVLASRDLDAIESIAMKTEGGGGIALPVRCDITKPHETDRMAELAVQHFGHIDGLINVASDTGPIGDATWNTSPEEFEHTMQVNLLGCFNTMRAVLPRMIARRYGKIVNVGGTYGMRARAGRMAYSASKWGLRGVTKSAAIEAGQHNINVNFVAPGMVDDERFRTKWIPEAMDKYGLDEAQAEVRHAEEYAMRRITTVNDVANACLFLASDVSRQITGVDLPVDGGWASL
ncbi:MAG TPA: SDR family oxidoreductase [Candidatus Aquabacterium excrementipullorum]|nr:SDR family oxidoreductase [Candidatus Aquabacterium excrementipullorum]